MHDVISIGNAIVDLIADVEHDTLLTHGLTKGSMMLVDEAQSAARTALVPDAAWMKASGGSAANTAACIASLGGKSAYIGKVGDDTLGSFFADDLKNIGVDFLENKRSEKQTARCLAMITPDGERTMSTYLGACRELSTIDINNLSHARIVFLEGYLLDSPRSAAAMIAAAEIASHRGITVALTLSDKYCVQRNRGAFEMLIDSGIVDIVIGNESEVPELCQSSDLKYAAAYAVAKKITVVITLGAKGAAACSPDGYWTDAEPGKVSAVVDLVGAGDAFAGGFLFGVAAGFELSRSLSLGNKSAAIVVESKGARPRVPLTTLWTDQKTLQPA
jgi:sugar/nucleoside kinase (ribokinase family)